MNPDFIKASAYLLEKIERRPAPAGEMINTYLATHKYLKGEDKKEFLTLVWGVIRARARLMWAYPEESWQKRIEKFAKSGLPDVSQAPQYIQWEVPEWFLDHVPDAEKELPSLLENPPIILRAIGNREEVLEALREEGLAVEPCEKSPYGIHLIEYAN